MLRVRRCLSDPWTYLSDEDGFLDFFLSLKNGRHVSPPGCWQMDSSLSVFRRVAKLVGKRRSFEIRQTLASDLVTDLYLLLI